MSLSSTVFGFQFLSLSLWLPVFNALFITRFFSIFQGGTKAPRRTQVTVRVDRSTWGGNHNSNFTFQHLLFTGLYPGELLYCVISLCECGTEQSWAFWERFCQECCKDEECQSKWHCPVKEELSQRGKKQKRRVLMLWKLDEEWQSEIWVQGKRLTLFNKRKTEKRQYYVTTPNPRLRSMTRFKSLLLTMSAQPQYCWGN